MYNGVPASGNPGIGAPVALTGYTNEADKGCCRNWFSVLCARAQESRLPSDFSDVVYCQAVQECGDGSGGGGGDGNQIVYDQNEASRAVASVYGKPSESAV